MSTLKSVTILHPSSAVNNIVNDASGNVAVGNNLTVAGTATITGATTVGGVAVVAVAPSTNGNVLTSNGTAWTSAAPSGGGLPTPSAIGQIPFSTNGSTYAATQKIVQGTAQASTSGTSIDFTGIPSWVKRVTVMFNGVSTNGSSDILLQLGTGSTTYVTTGYSSSSTRVSFSSTSGGSNSTAGFNISQGGPTVAISGLMVFCSMTGNLWAGNHSYGTPPNSNSIFGGGNITLGAVLTAVRITTANGTDTFDAGSINILYE